MCPDSQIEQMYTYGKNKCSCLICFVIVLYFKEQLEKV